MRPIGAAPSPVPALTGARASGGPSSSAACILRPARGRIPPCLPPSPVARAPTSAQMRPMRRRRDPPRPR
jgi:hypothetical protein